MRGHFQGIALASIIPFIPVLGVMPLTAMAADNADLPSICSPRWQVEKEKLAGVLLKTYPVSTNYLSVGKNATPLTSQRALVHWLLQKQKAEKGAACTDSDSCNVGRMNDAVQKLLDNQDPGFKAGGKKVPAADFFGSTGNASQATLQCNAADAKPSLEPIPAAVAPAAAAGSGTAAAGASASGAVAAAGSGSNGGTATSAPNNGAAPAPAQEKGWMDRLRVRGNPDQLSISPDNKAAFASVDRAKLSLANDDVAQSRTNDIVAYAGYALDKSTFNEAGSTYEAVPYIGFKQNRVTVYDGTNASVTTTRTTAVGVLSSFHFVHPGTTDTEDLTARPDYLINNTDGSRLLSANFTYTPIRVARLNDFIRLSDGISFKPILIGQSRNGIYTNRGDATVSADHEDFIRLGAQAGFTLASTNPRLPFDFTTTFTGLKALKGAQSIHYWKSVLTYNFNQNIGLSLNYSNGLLPDTADREKKWDLGISSKF
jgi:hypothetical protein